MYRNLLSGRERKSRMRLIRSMAHCPRGWPNIADCFALSTKHSRANAKQLELPSPFILRFLTVTRLHIQYVLYITPARFWLMLTRTATYDLLTVELCHTVILLRTVHSCIWQGSSFFVKGLPWMTPVQQMCT